jgi:hypothetical protein
MSETLEFANSDYNSTVDAAMSILDDLNTNAEGDEISTETESPEEDGSAEGEEPEATETEDPEGSEEGSDTFEIIIDGRKERRTREELISGYQKGSDYSKKTQALAEERKALEVERETTRARFEAEYNTAMQQALSIALADPILADAEKTNWNQLRQDDPYEYNVKKGRLADRVAQIQQIQAQQAQRQQANMQQHVEKERAAMFERIPEWKDPVVAKREADMSMKYLVEYAGYSKQELDGLVDSRQIKIIREAALYRAHLDAQKSVESKKVSKVVNSVKPGPSTNGKSKGSDALKRAARPGASTDERVNAIMKMLN